MADMTPPQAQDLSDYRDLIRRRWVWVILGLLLGLVAGLAYLQAKTPTYVSTTQVKVESTVADTSREDGRTSGPVNLDTEAQLVKSSPVAAAVAEEIGSSASQAALARRVTVTVPANTTVLAIAFEASTPEAAQAGAEAFAQAYLENRQSIAEDLITPQTELLKQRISDVNKKYVANVTKLRSTTDILSTGERAVLQVEQIQYRGELRRLQASLDPLQRSVVRPGNVIVEAQRPASPTTPNSVIVLASAVMVGLLLGLALATGRDRLDHRLHSAAEIEKHFGLAVVGELDLRKMSLDDVDPDGPAARQMRALAVAVQSATPSETPVVFVVSASDTSLARDVAREMTKGAASAGGRTTLLTRKSTTGSTSVAIARSAAGANIQVLTYQQVKLAGSAEFTSAAVPEVLSRARDGRDFVVLDAPTSEATVDVPLLARHVDIIVVVVEVGRTTRSRLNSLLTLSRRAGAPTICAVTVRRPRFMKRSRPAPDDITVMRDLKTSSRQSAPAEDEESSASSKPGVRG